MGNEASKPARPPWQDAQGRTYPHDIVRQIKELSHSPSTFLEPHPDFHEDDFDIQDYYEELEAAITSDVKLAQWLPKFVPNRLDEQEFWRNYLSHVLVLQRRGDSLLASSPQPDLSQPESLADSGAEIPEIHSAAFPEPVFPSQAESNEQDGSVSEEEISAAELDKKIQEYLDTSKDEAYTKDRQAVAPIRWGILGAGNVCEVKSGPALQKADGSSVTAVHRRSAEYAADFAQRHSIGKWYSDAQQLINDPNVDAVYIATPPNSHLHLAKLVAEAGKPCLVEKPLARSFEESYSLHEVFRTLEVPLFVAYYRRALPRFVLTKKLIDNQDLGQVTSVTYRLCRTDHVSGREIGWRVDPAISGGGLFVDMGCHVLDILDYCLGPLQSVAGEASVAPNVKSAVETAVSMRFVAGSAQCTALFNFASGVYEDCLIINGTRAQLSLSVFGKDYPVLTTSSGITREIEVDHPEHVHQPLVQRIVDELRGIQRTECPSKAANALRTARVVDTVLRSFYGDRSDNFWERPQTWRC